jgi:hypothetical protein
MSAELTTAAPLPVYAQPIFEFSLAEFPFVLLSKHGPEVTSINYQDSITFKDQKIPRTWCVEWGSGSTAPCQSTLETFFTLLQVWKEQTFLSPWIHFGSISSLLSRRGLKPTGNNIKRTINDLDTLTKLSIKAKNAFWSPPESRYCDATFHLFETLILEKNTPGSPDLSSKGFIRAHPVLHNSILNNSFFPLPIDVKLFHTLSGLQQRLYIFLTKMRKFFPIITRPLLEFASQLPLHTKSTPRLKQQIRSSFAALIQSELFPQDFTLDFYKSSSGITMVRFSSKDPTQLSLFNTPDISEQENAYKLITEFCGDIHSFPFYKKVASSVPYEIIYQAVSECKASLATDELKKSRGAFFTSRVKSLAKQYGHAL